MDNGAHIAPVLQSYGAQLSPSDMGRLTDILYGVQRWRGWLDHVIQSFSHRPIERSHPQVLNVLRAGIYQIVFTRRPPYAVTDEAVGYIKTGSQKNAAAYINSVLRKVTSTEDPWKLLPESGPPSLILSLKYSHPEWIVRRWLKNFGRNHTEAILKTNQNPPSVELLVNLNHTSREAIRKELEEENILTEVITEVPSALRVTHGNIVRVMERYKNRIYIQDGHAQFLGQVAASLGGRYVIDLCGAPGGKTISLLNHADPASIVVNDHSLPRLLWSRKNLNNLGYEGVKFFTSDATHSSFLACSFDTVILDAPCSGTGTLCKNPEIRWRLREEDIQTYSDDQKRLLNSALEILKPGGYLLYCTCSLEPEENEEVVLTILKERKDCKIYSFKNSELDNITYHVDKKGVLRLFPFQSPGGFSSLTIFRVT